MTKSETESAPKRKRMSGELGQGWDRFTPERSPDPGSKQSLKTKTKPKTFNDIFSGDPVEKFRNTVEDIITEEGRITEDESQKGPRSDTVTPVKTKVVRYETKIKKPRVSQENKKG